MEQKEYFNSIMGEKIPLNRIKRTVSVLEDALKNDMNSCVYQVKLYMCLIP